MNQPTTQPSYSPPWLLIVGLVLGVSFIAYIMWDTFVPSSPKGSQTRSANVVELTSDTWQKEVIESKVPVVVDFTAKWCPPCQAFAPTLDKVADQYKGKVKVAKFDVGDHSFNKATKLAGEYGISGIPHIMIFKDGEPRRQFTGITSEVELTRAIERVLQ